MVSNPRTGQSVTVRITDRGPWIAGRIIDLSHAAARSIGLSGLGQVIVERTEASDSGTPD
jgi:rare lipoprotein A